MKTFILALLLALFTAYPSSSQDAADLRVRAAKIKVVNLDEAVVFYRDVLGLNVLAKERGSVTLDGGSMPVILEKAEHASAGGYPQKSQTILVFQTSDIRSTMARLRRSGVAIVGGDEPEPYGFNRESGNPLGLSSKFRDPSGIVHSLVEQQVEAETFNGIRVYNIGFYLPDMEAARALYCDALGFVALTDAYLPTAIPVGYADNTLAFMLHARPNLEPAPVRYPEDAQSMIVYESPDLDATLKRLDAHGIELLHDAPQSRPGERFVAFRDQFGNVSEIVERL